MLSTEPAASQCELSLVQLAALRLFIGEAGRVDEAVILAGVMITLLGALLSLHRRR